MPETSSKTLCDTLSSKVYNTLKPLAEGYDRHVLLDFPSHWNIGDSAIWLGEVDILQRVHGRRPDYVSHIRYPLDQIEGYLPENGLIYLHGGGNFGDIWPRYQNHREAVIKRYPQHRIVQLPQSLHYSDPAGIEATKRAIGSHPDFHLLVRDRQGVAFAQEHFDCNVHLVPDSAFGIDMTRFARNAAPQGLGGIFRTDQEQRDDAADAVTFFGDVASEDWRVPSLFDQMREKATMGAFMKLPQRWMGGAGSKAFDALACHKVGVGFTQIDRHAVMVTDRLHGHIMATLLGKPHVVIDNFYGKITNFIDAFGADDVTLRASSFKEAREMADQLLAQTGSAA